MHGQWRLRLDEVTARIWLRVRLQAGWGRTLGEEHGSIEQRRVGNERC